MTSLNHIRGPLTRHRQHAWMLGLSVALQGCLWPHPSVVADTVPTAPTVAGSGGLIPAAQARREVTKAVEGAPDPDSIRRLESLMETISDQPLYRNNKVELLVDGPATYKVMLEEIGSAEHHVHLETYIFNDDAVGRRFADALIARSRAGVEVRIIYDSLGSRASADAFFERLKAAKIDVLEFHPTNPVNGGNPFNANVRDHRKLLVVDGQVAFTGGINIDRNYSSSSGLFQRRKRPLPRAGWRDTHVAVRGPAVAGFQDLFLRHWEQQGGKPTGPRTSYFPDPEVKGDHLVRVLASTGGNDNSPIRSAYELAIESARERVWLTQSYFGPDPAMIDAMTNAARRGVDIRIILSGVSDAILMLSLSRSYYGELLEAGVKVYESDDLMLHAKTAVVDRVWATVGSSNLDYRSFLHNNEVNAVMLGRDFGERLEELFQNDLERSKAVTLEEYNDRGIAERAKELVARSFRYWL